jgi:hypothetical protein
MEELIKQVVKSFYTTAVQDIIIGYHFRKIQEFESSDVLSPPIEAFAGHLPRINAFWELQLLATPIPVTETPFNIIQVHEYLSLRRGEIGRWVTIFNQTIDSFEDDNNRHFLNNWKEKIKQFEKRFLNSSHLFSA